MNTSTKNGVKKTVERERITVTRVYKATHQKSGTLTAELKVKVTTKTTYPSIKIENNLQDNMFSLAQFKKGEGETYTHLETRVAWVNVPETATVETVTAALANFPNAGLYKIVSNRPIISDNQQSAIDDDEIDFSLADVANNQIVRYPEGHEKAGNIVLDRNNKVQYRAVFYMNIVPEDSDLRNADMEDYYSTEEIDAELNHEAHVVLGQSIGM